MRPESVVDENPNPTVSLLGVAVNAVDFATTLDRIDAWVKSRRATPSLPCRQICTVNPEFIVDAGRDPAFAAVLGRADLRVPDGVGVLWAARLFGIRLNERVTGSDGIYRICRRAADHGWRVYFLGAAPGVAARTAATLARRYPGLTVAGSYPGSPNAADWQEIHARLVKAQPDILFVAFGHPRQDFWIDTHRADLPAAVAIGVGGAFDFVTGVTVRAPKWIQRLGLEWLHRLVRQPWRWRRIAKLPRFVVLVVWQKLRGG